MSYELPPLEYAYDSLEPFIDEKTMQIHHDKHHLAYVNDSRTEDNLWHQAKVTVCSRSPKALLKVRPDVKVIDDPYTGKPVAAFPAVKCDVAVATCTGKSRSCARYNTASGRAPREPASSSARFAAMGIDSPRT